MSRDTTPSGVAGSESSEGRAAMPLVVTDPTEAEVTITGLCKSYGGRAAVSDLSLSIARGEAIGLLGPNGAGKSTLMLLLAGVMDPDAGCIGLGPERRDPRHPSARAGVGFAPQSLALYSRLTAEENLRFFGRTCGLRGRRLEERVRLGLEVSALSARAKDRVETFSGGMKRRLNLACAVVHEPRLLLLDEPTAGIDPQSRDHVLLAIEELKATGVTVVYSTHYVEELSRLCDRVAILDRGRLLAFDTVERLVRSQIGAVVVEVRRAGLEDVLLHLTGRKLRD